jgi:putative PIN family toxin of toxin-antitoxin system
MVERVVADTNVLISALGWKGNERDLLNLAIDNKIKLVFSKETFEELIRVMNYPKFGFSKKQKTRFILILSTIGSFVKIREKLQVIKDDPSDNRFLETAVDGKASYIVSGDEHLLKIKDFRGIKIISSREFIGSVI